MYFYNTCNSAVKLRVIFLINDIFIHSFIDLFIHSFIDLFIHAKLAPWASGIHFFVKIGMFGVPHFHILATDFLIFRHDQ